MYAAIQHRNSFDHVIDERHAAGNSNEAAFQRKIKKVLTTMIRENVVELGDRFVVVEIS